jgi:hypothetical protein
MLQIYIDLMCDEGMFYSEKTDYQILWLDLFQRCYSAVRLFASAEIALYTPGMGVN